MREEIKSGLIYIGMFVGFIGLMVIIIGSCINSSQVAEYKQVKSGAVARVEYLDNGGFGEVSTTILHFKDGASVTLCGTRDVYTPACVNVYKVQNKSCTYDYIESCEE